MAGGKKTISCPDCKMNFEVEESTQKSYDNFNRAGKIVFLAYSYGHVCGVTVASKDSSNEPDRRITDFINGLNQLARDTGIRIAPVYGDDFVFITPPDYNNPVVIYNKKSEQYELWKKPED